MAACACADEDQAIDALLVASRVFPENDLLPGAQTVTPLPGPDVLGPLPISEEVARLSVRAPLAVGSELVARIRAVLRRRAEPDELITATVAAGPVRMDVERHVVSVDGESVTMPLKEFELLEMLLRNAGRVLTRGQLIDRVWGSDYVGDTKTQDVHIKRLRSKVEPDPSQPRHIVTVRGLGYKFEA